MRVKFLVLAALVIVSFAGMRIDDEASNRPVVKGAERAAPKKQGVKFQRLQSSLKNPASTILPG